MLRCTYIVLIHNNESNIIKLVDSLKMIAGNFHKEFIFVDDGSTDNSLGLLKTKVNDLPRTTIITQEMEGPTVSVNKAISLATGDYIHFVEGDEVLQINSTSVLMESCLKLGVEVAIGHVAQTISASSKSSGVWQIIQNPINEILLGKIDRVREVGRSGSVVHNKLLDKIAKADSSIYTQNMSLSLRCAKYSKFALLEDYVTTAVDRQNDFDKKFRSYNNLKSIYNFSKENTEIFSNLTSELLMTLSRESLGKSDKINYAMKSLVGKYIKSTSIDGVLTLYKLELEKLF
ncbi:MAG: glycosyltransferase family 2 protein [Rickettsiaceae bacterium]|nr:glycosyltransferase family 2 protein [Rickettsiaceae bacterium]